MSDSREQFEAWAKAPPFEFDLDRFNGIEAWPGAYRNYPTHCAWDAWQAAEAETARRCAELPPNGLHILASAMPHTVWEAYQNAIRAEFPEAWMGVKAK